jgi:hypothetical protein
VGARAKMLLIWRHGRKRQEEARSRMRTFRGGLSGTLHAQHTTVRHTWTNEEDCMISHVSACTYGTGVARCMLRCMFACSLYEHPAEASTHAGRRSQDGCSGWRGLEMGTARPSAPARQSGSLPTTGAMPWGPPETCFVARLVLLCTKIISRK